MDLAGATSTVDSSSSSSSVSSTATSHDCDSPRGGDVDHELLRTTSVSVSVSLSSSSSASIQRVLSLIRSEDPDSRLFAAKEIRRLTKTSHRCRRHFSQAVEPLVSMLRFESPESHHEAALLALLNLAVKDEKNKVSIIEAGALEPIINFLQCNSTTLQEYASASLLTLSASATNKPIIGANGVIPLLVKVIQHGSPQAKVDAVMALSNLSTLSTNLCMIIATKPLLPILSLLKSSKKSSKTSEKCCSLIESLIVSGEEARTGLVSYEGGVFAVVEVLENGSLQAREHSVGVLLTLCQSDRSKYREPILREGVIPGLLELTVQGTSKSRTKAQRLLSLLRNSKSPRSEVQPDTIENIVSSLISHIDGDDQSGKAKKMLAEMVQVSMEKSLRHLQERASTLVRP
ncbi:PREDICTED: U-box domain-containing protein 7 [Brassica oleracea var. oleracea]|uniref:Armadillo repeat-containing domain-containing protein n=1 Tax=Brassica oleracea var. oleracea TaxID=109376 RepID=A0A0D3CN14_BRAOL|nr:PREDICTED: U-box domain-containing protein 7 [Brassica oleracea var. oleracea]